MLNLSSYVPSLEEFEQVPSPLMDGDGVAPVVEGAIVGQLPTEGFPVEQSAVELPPALDPTPLQPLEAGIVQEEVISENLDAEVGQLMGAQIALEGYGKLLRSAGKNMTRQSAAFMAVGMARANRILGVTTLGLENEESGTQVMAMQTAKVDEKGLGDKIKQIAGKIWEWLKQKSKQFMELIQKLRGNKEKTRNEVVYLIAATEAVESGNKSKVEALEAPKGLSTTQVLDAIHGDKAHKPTNKTVQLPAKLVPFLTKDGKLDLNLTAENELRSKGFVEFLKDATGLVKDITSTFMGFDKNTSVEEVTDTLSDMVKKHLGGKANRWELHGATVERTAEGKLIFEREEANEGVEVALPSLQEIRQYLGDVKKVLDSDLTDGEAVAKAYHKAVDDMLTASDKIDAKIGQERGQEISSAIGKVLQGNSFEDTLGQVGNYLDRTSTAAAKGCDFFIAAHLGKTNTISQEDYLALPGPSGASNGIAGKVKAGWAKTKEFFARLWKQFTDWVKGIWDRLFGEEKKVDMLLLTNEYVPEGGAAPSGTPPALPPGTGLRSVAAARALPAPSTGGVEAPAPVQEAEPEPAAPERSVPKGFVYVESSGKLALAAGYALEPSIEEAYIAWFNDSYKPALIKMWRDVTSLVQSNFDVAAYDTWGATLTKMAERCMQGAPTGEWPGGVDIGLNPGSICFSFGPSEKKEPEPIKALNKRQIAQILSRQKKASNGLDKVQSVFAEVGKLADTFDQATDRLIEQADDATADHFAKFYTTARRLMNNNAIGQMGTMFFSTFKARTELMDAMIAARAKGTV